MVEFAQGLVLEVTDRNAFDAYITENAHDPASQTEAWGANSVPDTIYIVNYNRDDPSYYRTVDHHVNGETSSNYWNENLLDAMLSKGILTKAGYDVEFVQKHIK